MVNNTGLITLCCLKPSLVVFWFHVVWMYIIFAMPNSLINCHIIFLRTLMTAFSRSRNAAITLSSQGESVIFCVFSFSEFSLLCYSASFNSMRSVNLDFNIFFFTFNITQYTNILYSVDSLVCHQYPILAG